MGNLENSINFNNVITPEEEKSPSTNKTPEQIEEQGFIEKVIKKVATKILKQFFKKKSPTDYIESTPEPTIEHLFRKYPGEQPTDITDYFLSTNDEANEIETIESFHDKRTAMDIHTHPSASTSKIPKESYEKLIGKKYNMKGTLEEVNNIINKR